MPEPGKAVTDVRYLLDRGYPVKGAITFVCNHYRLDIKWRYVFTRVVFDKDTIKSRRKKTVKCEDLKGEVVLVDGYNVLIGVESALKGEFHCIITLIFNAVFLTSASSSFVARPSASAISSFSIGSWRASSL